MKYALVIAFFIVNLFAIDLFKPLPTQIQYDKDIVNLGRELFYEPMLSKNNDLSCFSCHFNYGADNKQFSIGDENQLGFINTPSVFNAKYKIRYFWNGRSETLKDQLLNGPLFTKHEMASTKKIIEKRLNSSKKYIKLFSKAYGTKPNIEEMVDALVQFEDTLISGDSKFDNYLKGEAELSKKEQKGLGLFISYGCVSCHNGINLGGNSYQKLGSVIEAATHNEKWIDKFSISKKDEDKMVFIVPSLRNIEKTAPYFHSGDVEDLKDAIKLMGYYNIGIILQDNEIDNIEAFLKTLTGKLPKTFLKENEL